MTANRYGAEKSADWAVLGDAARELAGHIHISVQSAGDAIGEGEVSAKFAQERAVDSSLPNSPEETVGRENGIGRGAVVHGADFVFAAGKYRAQMISGRRAEDLDRMVRNKGPLRTVSDPKFPIWQDGQSLGVQVGANLPDESARQG